MANLVAMNMKRKEHAEVSNHGLSIFLDPKRLKLQDGEIPDMMEEEKAGAPTDANVPAMASSSWLQPTQDQKAVHHTLNIPYGMASSEPPFQAATATATVAAMDIEVELQQRQPQAQPCQQAPFWSGFF
ncbi:uncharacterized protein LOC102721385 [Oryza brachyantha]|uniref:uncharacterized protein LOC102721385 n=1 Tax=Oryza brachyantha TaxID=4533 RepID=UPI0003EA9153|nr:uncharacterized protein LOC102721385 [Oryza brachyantha]